MNDSIISPNKNFEGAKKSDENGIEFWMARDLMLLLGYTEWRNFEEVIAKAAQACMNSGQAVDNHFGKVNKMVRIGSNAVKEIRDWKLDRYACYLIAQNGDSRKEEIAMAQTYFVLQTRKQEVFQQLTEEKKRIFIRTEVSGENKKLFRTAKKAGVSKFGLFNNAGYRGLYGLPISDIEKKKGLKKGELLDRAGSTELAANLFRITQTEEKITKDSIKGEELATRTHFMVGGKVRQTIKDIGGILPEQLKPQEHIREIKKKLKGLQRSKLLNIQ